MTALPKISIVVETINWDDSHTIRLEHTLQALAHQSLPQGQAEVLVILGTQHAHRRRWLHTAYPWVGILEPPPDTSYYQMKNFGGLRARGELVGFVDSDSLPNREWGEEAIRTFKQVPKDVASVQGKTIFREATLSRLWDPLWWVKAFEEEGPLDMIYNSNNIVYHRSVFERIHFLDEPLPVVGLERVMSRQLTAAGYRSWLNPRMLVRHDYHPTPRAWAAMAVWRGFHLIFLRRRYPGPGEGWVDRLGAFSPALALPGILAKDFWRMISKAPRLELGPAAVYKLPLYLLLLLPLDAVVFAGMLWGAFSDRPPRHPD